MGEVKLRECPFCGSQDMLEGDPWHGGKDAGYTVRIACGWCGAKGPVGGGVPQHADSAAAAAWNRRATPPGAVEVFVVELLDDPNETWVVVEVYTPDDWHTGQQRELHIGLEEQPEGTPWAHTNEAGLAWTYRWRRYLAIPHPTPTEET